VRHLGHLTRIGRRTTTVLNILRYFSRFL